MEPVRPPDTDPVDTPKDERRDAAPSSLVWEAFDQAPAFIAVLRHPGHVFEYTNQAYYRLIGFRDVVGLPVLEALPEVEGQGFFQLLDRVRATGEPYVGEEVRIFVQHMPGGTPEERFLDFVYQPLKGPDGAPSGILVQGVDVTARVLAERAVRESEGRLRALYDGTHEYIGLLDTDGTVLEANRASLSFAALTREEVVGRPFWETSWFAGTPGALALVRAAVARATAGESVRFETDLRRPDGHARTLDVSFHPARDERGAVVYVVAEGRDVSDQKKGREALRASADRAAFRAALGDALRSLSGPAEVQAETARVLGEHLGASRAFYSEVDPDDVHVRIGGDYHDGASSVRGTHVLGSYNASALTAYRAGQTVVTADTEADPALSADARAAYASIEARAFVSVPIVKDGRLAALLTVHQSGPRAWTAAEVALIEETAERTWAAVERTRAEAALRESEARYRTLFTAMDEGFCVIEVLFDAEDRPVDYRFLETNPAFLKHTGLEAAVGRTILEMVPEFDAHWFETYGRVARTGEPVRFIDEARALGRWYDVYAFPLGAPGDARVAVLFNDVSDQKRAEQEVGALNAALQGQVRTGTRQIRQLAARLTDAEQAERERIAHVLHDDLQQQLFGLAMVLSLLKRGPAAEDAGALLGQATEILDTAAGLTRSLATELSPAVLRADRLRDLLEWTATSKRAKYGLDVTVEVTGDPVVADSAPRVLLYQALCEVLFNVAKHAGTPSARLVGWAEGGYAVVRVEDDGVGFDMAAVAARAGGFGLPSVRERLELIGGRFSIESAPGAGTRTTIGVPLRLA